MSQTSETIDPWSTYWTAIVVATTNLFWITIATTITQFVLMVLVAWHEYQARFKTALSPINLRILGLALFNLISYIFQTIGVNTTDPTVYSTTMAVGNACSYLLSFLIIEYGWIRGFNIVQQCFKNSIPYLRFMLIFYGVLQLTQGVLYAWISFTNQSTPEYANLTTIEAYLSLGAQVIAFAFDFFLLGVFIVYLRRGREDATLIDTERLSVVARYGILSFWVNQVCLVATVALYFVFGMVEPPISITAVIIIYYIENCAPIVYVFLQIAMKWSIHVAREAAMSNNRSSATTENKTPRLSRKN
ncbi:hypothetical protein BC830DRAFT_1143745 [Chytriomyces sp. MP71]|nr:hypothetical protein BC830DRAFT_1143745 [Chytriomyces sp. MP71]